MDTLYIRVLDVNDNPPSFDQILYTEQIYENASMGSYVLTVYAEDLDTMLDAEILYDFHIRMFQELRFLFLFLFPIAPPQINGIPTFTINSTTGEIYVNTDLDLERSGALSTYSLTVKVTACMRCIYI